MHLDRNLAFIVNQVNVALTVHVGMIRDDNIDVTDNDEEYTKSSE